MFRDVHLITEDFSVRVQLGMVIFRWWRPLTHKEITEGKSLSFRDRLVKPKTTREVLIEKPKNCD